MYSILNIKPSYIGKVRDVFDLGDALILVSTDRISAFDVVFNETIPDKGKVLNHVSIAWFDFFSDVKNHIIETDYKKFPEPFRSEKYLDGRSILVKKCKRIDYECVVRGYISGSAFKEYSKTGQIAFKDYPKGLLESEELAEPIFTPARKNDVGHDENISEEMMSTEVGKELFDKLKNTSLHLYKVAKEKLEKSGLILCDTKFEFGLVGDEVILIDELLTPDSSRYWEKSTYQKGISPPSLDKQILRNYLETLDWDKNPPPPPLSKEIQLELKRKYEILEEIIIQCTSRK